MVSEHYLTVGGADVCLANPAPAMIDLDVLADRLDTIHRFSGDPTAMTVGHHSRFLEQLCVADPLGWTADLTMDQKADLDRLAYYHDYHEAIVGDLPGPVKAYLRSHGCTLFDDICERLDQAIFAAAGFTPPDAYVAEILGSFDKLAQALEWRYHMHRPWVEWCHPDARKVPSTLARALIEVSQKG